MSNETPVAIDPAIWMPSFRRIGRTSGTSRASAFGAGPSRVSAEAEVTPELVTKRIWKERFEDIRNFEQYLTRNGVVILKFFLHVSKKEQKRRFGRWKMATPWD